MTEPEDLHYMPDVERHCGAASRARRAALRARIDQYLANHPIGKAADEESRHSPSDVR